MEPIKFNGYNTEIAKDQDEYNTLPAFVNFDSIEKDVVSCWKMTWKERIKVLFSGEIFLTIRTYGDPLQPQLLDVDKPDIVDEL
jgi:hypothetical protein